MTSPFTVVDQCSLDGCDKSRRALGYCNLHYQRLRRHGDPTVYFGQTGRPLAGEYPTFIAIHARLRRKRGPARNFDCVDCGKKAREWSYNNMDPDEIQGWSGRWPVALSLNLDNYEPRCASCHRKFDFKHRNGSK